jgi:protein phosphatase
MATTVVAAVIRGDALIVANVGDSRAYVIRGDSIEQITEDHSLIAEMLNDGVINAEQAATHPYRNVILRSVGAYETVQVDLFARQIAPEDILVLCSDGLTHLVSNQELVDIVGAHSPAEAAQSLVALANERGGDDNISVSITYISHEKMEGDIPGTGQLPDTPRWEDLQHP